MILKFNDNNYNIDSFSFSETNAWFIFNSESKTYNELLELFSDLDVDILMEIYTDDETLLEAHVGYNYLQSIVYDNASKTFTVELIKEPLKHRLDALEETIDFLLMEEL